MNPKYLIMRNRRTGLPVHVRTDSIPVEIRPDKWFENPDWRYRTDRGDLEPLVRALFSEELLSKEQIKELAQYIVDYAGNLAAAVYLFGGKEALDFNAECMRRLREIRDLASTKDDVREMISVGIDYALDFF